VVRTKPAGCSVTPPTNAHCWAGRPLTPTWPVIASKCRTSHRHKTDGTVNLRFVIADSRVNVGIIGMRWPEEVERNVAAIAGWTPPVDIANLPRWTFEVYKHLAGG
jgi:hypothetical protein